jgi:hypothetical protein
VSPRRIEAVLITVGVTLAIMVVLAIVLAGCQAPLR